MPSDCPSVWVSSKSPPSAQKNIRLALTLTLNKKHFSEILFKQIIIKFLLIQWFVLRWGYNVKYFFQSISWNTYFTIVSLCKLPRTVHETLFEVFHGLSWNTKILKIDFQNFLYRERLWFVFMHEHAWLILGSFIKRQTSGTSSDNKWQRVTANDNKWQRMTMSDREEPTTMHPKENSLNL